MKEKHGMNQESETPVLDMRRTNKIVNFFGYVTKNP